VALQTVWVLVAVGFIGMLIGTGRHGDAYLAAAVTIAAIATLVTTPLVVHFGLWVLRTEANDSMTDQLTGLLNRRGLNLQIGTLVQGHALVDLADAAVAVMVIDLDRFKHVNDTYGHAVGDSVLIRSARRITCAVRSSALIARVGGEEFVVVDVIEQQHIPRISERVRVAIEATADTVPVTASVGVAAVSVDCFKRTASDPVAILGAAIECADHAMFEAKRKGGNATTHRHLFESSAGDDGGITCDCVGQTADSTLTAGRDDG
jgi:diguanylate cyclase (GGDEF)-like protein